MLFVVCVKFITQCRRRFDILADVVRAACPGARKTRIMFLANLGYALLKRYLEAAVSLGFLRTSAEEFLVIPRGEKFLAKYCAFRNASSHVKADLKNLKSETELLEHMCKLKGNRRACKRSRLAAYPSWN
jgi:predicted transcriptional regulator